jgi:hypothetical protein
MNPDAPVTTNFIAQLSPRDNLTEDDAGAMLLNGTSGSKSQDERE